MSLCHRVHCQNLCSHKYLHPIVPEPAGRKLAVEAAAAVAAAVAVAAAALGLAVVAVAMGMRIGR